MSWRTVIISSTAKLDYQMGYLVIRKDDVTKIHLSEIETVMIESTSVSLTAALLCELTKKKIKVIFCDEKRNPSSELISYYGAHDLSLIHILDRVFDGVIHSAAGRRYNFHDPVRSTGAATVCELAALRTRICQRTDTLCVVSI